MATTPAAALDLPAAHGSAMARAEVLSTGPAQANGWRRHHRHHDSGVDAGDVIAGVLVVGALAAILGSANNRKQDRERYEEQRVRYDDRRETDSDSRGIQGAVDMCVDQVEYRDNRVDSVDRADRSASGWNVSGTLDDGERWNCFIDNGGDVRSIDYGAASYSQAPATVAPSGQQLSDAAYARARASTRTPADTGYSFEDGVSYEEDAVADVPGADDPRPAYPGGPLPGEEGFDADWQPDGEEVDGDSRYDT